MVVVVVVVVLVLVVVVVAAVRFSPLTEDLRFNQHSQDELANEGRVTGCGGYGTLFPFVFAFLIGGFAKFVLDIEAGEYIMGAGGAWILGGQINLYRRINHLYEREGKEAPLHAWWAALPPPFDRKSCILPILFIHPLSHQYPPCHRYPHRSPLVAAASHPLLHSPLRHLCSHSRAQAGPLSRKVLG